MTEPGSAAPELARPVLHWRRPSLVWFIPLVAALIGAWMAVKALSERGPTITITFQSAEGLEAGQTRIRHKGVEVGKITAVTLTPDFSQAVATAEMASGTGPLLTAGSRFWVARARISSNGVSGLGTILSGAYIDLDPGPPGPPARAFHGLETPPVRPPQAPGEVIELRAEKLGSLTIGSPVTFRQIRVGEVAAFDLDPDGHSVVIKALIQAPYNGLVRVNTRFWDSGGVDASLDTSGLRLHADSVVTLLLGGIALDNPDGPAQAAPADQVFTLYPSAEKAHEPVFGERRLFVLNFADSVRGLARGAPVEFMGVKVGQVESLKLEFRTRDLVARIPVLVALEPERFGFTGPREPEAEVLLARMVRKGLRAQLKPGSLLTGNLYVDLAFHPEAGAARLTRAAGYPELPTLPSSLGALVDNLGRFAERLQRLPVEEVFDQLRRTLPQLRETLEQAKALIGRLDRETLPQAQATLAQGQAALAALDRALRADSPVQTDLAQALQDFAQAARALRDLADTLERHPQALIFGKGKQP